MKILIGVVTAKIKDYCWYDFKYQLKKFEKQGFDVYVVDNSPTPTSRGFKSKWIKPSSTPQQTTVECMNEIRRYFLKGNYDKLWVLESDVFVSDEGVERLLNMGGDVNNLTYPMKLERFTKYSLCVQSTLSNQALMLNPEESKLLLNNGVIRLGEYKHCGKVVTHTGYGCTLIDRKVLENITFKSLKSGTKLPYPDSFFHTDVNKQGFVNLLDTDFVCEHRNLRGETNREIQKMKDAHIPRKLRRQMIKAMKK